MASSRSILACAGISSVLGQDLFISESGGRRRRSAAPDSSYLVGIRNCGLQEAFQSWTFDSTTQLLQMRHTEFGWEEYCLAVDQAEYAIVTKCIEGDLTQQWTNEPNNAGGHRYKNLASNLCLQLDANDDDPEAVTVGFCNDVEGAGWWEEVDSIPVNSLRTVAFDESAAGGGQMKCLSALTQDDVPGQKPIQDASVCQHVMLALPDVSIPFIGPLDLDLGIKASLENFTLKLPELVGNFTSCGFYDAAPGGLPAHKGTLTLDMDIPQIPLDVPWWHVARPPLSLSGSASGWVHAVISVKLDYNLQNLSLDCSGFDMTLPDLDLKLKGGGLLAPVVKLVSGAIESLIKNNVPKVANPEICPIINRKTAIVEQCSDAASAGPVAFAQCLFNGPSCTTSPCFACDGETGSCAEVDAGTEHSVSTIDLCSETCIAPAPPAPCIEDEQCTDGGVEHSCCSGSIYKKGIGCKYGTCGCLKPGTCTGIGHHSDCCSGKAKKSLLCDALLGWRCK